RARRRPLPLAARGAALRGSAAPARTAPRSLRRAVDAAAAGAGMGRGSRRPARGAGVPAPGPARTGERAVSRARAAGFTLIEVLLATVLLASGLALGFATVRAATATAERGEAIAARTERMRAVEGFLRRRLAGAQTIAFAQDPTNGGTLRFVGEPDR